MPDLIGLDSNAMTRLIEAMRPGYNPKQDDAQLASERLAMIRIFVYGARSLHLTPTTASEYRNIRDAEKFQEHSRTACILLEDGPWRLDAIGVQERGAELQQHYTHANDCRIIAEAELLGLTHLLTCEPNFARRLNPVSRVSIESPTTYWTGLGIGPGAKAVWEPHSSNPLHGMDWWRI